MGDQFTQADFDLLKKYDRPGPRYTSYPTAPLFNHAFTHDAYRREIEATNGGGAAGDISLYFHFPFSIVSFFHRCFVNEHDGDIVADRINQ